MDRQKSRRVVRLSRVDQERLDKGEIQTPEEAVHLFDAGPIRSDRKGPAGTQDQAGKKVGQGEQLSPRDREILSDRPPHFGKL